MLKLFQKIETAVSYILSNSINEKKFLKKKLNKKEIIVIDIGANVGSYLDFIIKNFKYKKIYAFEPSTKAYRQLKNKFNSKNIILENIALSNKKTKRKFYEYKLTSQSSFYKITSKKNPFKNLNNIYKVKTLRLDEYLNLKENKIDICKIDIQGEELNVLMGMQKYLKKKKIKLIKVEITIRNDYDNNKNQFVEIINFLKKFNYDLVTISKIKFSQNEIMFLDAYFQ
tara:strand:- start:263 stop:943 length:681 start_codon:yes stop_codon:yes gene_type:complete